MGDSRKIIKRASLSLVAALTIMFASTSPVWADVTINEYGGLTGNTPHGIVQGPDGNMWFAEFDVDMVGYITPDGSSVQEYPLTAGAWPHHMSVGPEDRMWFTEYGHETGVGPTGAAGIGVVDTSGNVNEYPFPNSAPYGADPRPHDITPGPDGNLWFTLIGSHAVGRIQTDGTLLAPFPLGAGVDPYGIAVGSDGDLWITDWGSSDQIIQMDSSGNVVNTYPITGGYSEPYGITAGPDGNLWFTLQGGSQDAVAKINPSNGQIDYYPLASNGGNSSPHDIVAGPDGNLWFTEQSAHQVGMITTDGQITEYPTPTNPSGPFGIATGPNNTIWFTASGATQIGVISGLTIPPTPTPPTPAPTPDGGTTPIPGAPSTGFGNHQTSPLQSLIPYILGATLLLGTALLTRKFAKQN
jgi:streptogramin lyase